MGRLTDFPTSFYNIYKLFPYCGKGQIFSSVHYYTSDYWERCLLTVSLPKVNLTKPRKLLKPVNCPTKPKCVTTQMKALDEYFEL